MKPTPELIAEFAPTGKLRAALNMGNPVLAHSKTSSEKPAGVSIDLARAFAELLGVEAVFLQFDTPGKSGAAIGAHEADIGFLAVDPQRAERIHFTAPYIEIEGCYVVREDSPLQTNGDVDQPGIQIVAGIASAYELYLSRNLKNAKVLTVPTSEGVMRSWLAMPQAQAAAGVKQQLQADAKREGGVRLIPGRFMVISQAMAMPRDTSAAAQEFLGTYIAQQKASGFVAEALKRHGIEGASVAA
jgi:polar amino acid transport system substrate-binding protein